MEFAGDSPELRLELTCDDEPLIYCDALRGVREYVVAAPGDDSETPPGHHQGSI